MNSRRRVNSTVIAPPIEKLRPRGAAGLLGVALSARLVACGGNSVGRRANKSLDRSAFSGPRMRQLASCSVACAPGQLRRWVALPLNHEANLLHWFLLP